MKPISLSLVALLFSNIASATPLNWADLGPDMNVTLASDLSVPGLLLPAGTQFMITDSTSLDIDVQVIETRISPCPSSLATKAIDLEMADADYGFELSPGCKVEWFVESKDLYRPSYFQ